MIDLGDPRLYEHLTVEPPAPTPPPPPQLVGGIVDAPTPKPSVEPDYTYIDPDNPPALDAEALKARLNAANVAKITSAVPTGRRSRGSQVVEKWLRNAAPVVGVKPNDDVIYYSTGFPGLFQQDSSSWWNAQTAPVVDRNPMRRASEILQRSNDWLSEVLGNCETPKLRCYTWLPGDEFDPAQFPTFASPYHLEVGRKLIEAMNEASDTPFQQGPRSILPPDQWFIPMTPQDRYRGWYYIEPPIIPMTWWPGTSSYWQPSALPPLPAHIEGCDYVR